MMNIQELIEELKTFPPCSPVYFSRDLRTVEAFPVIAAASGEDETGEAVFLTCDESE